MWSVLRFVRPYISSLVERNCSLPFPDLRHHIEDTRPIHVLCAGVHFTGFATEVYSLVSETFHTTYGFWCDDPAPKGDGRQVEVVVVTVKPTRPRRVTPGVGSRE